MIDDLISNFEFRISNPKDSNETLAKVVEFVGAGNGRRGIPAILRAPQSKASGKNAPNARGILCEPAEREIFAPQPVLLTLRPLAGESDRRVRAGSG